MSTSTLDSVRLGLYLDMWDYSISLHLAMVMYPKQKVIHIDLLSYFPRVHQPVSRDMDI
jgi:hypothetical protein